MPRGEGDAGAALVLAPSPGSEGAAPAGAPRRRRATRATRKAAAAKARRGGRTSAPVIPEVVEQELQDARGREHLRVWSDRSLPDLLSRAAPRLDMAATLADSDDSPEEAPDPAEVQYGDEFGELELESGDALLPDPTPLLAPDEGLLSYAADGGLAAAAACAVYRGLLPKQARWVRRRRSKEERRAARARTAAAVVAAEATAAAEARPGPSDRARLIRRVTPAAVRCCNRLACMQGPDGRSYLLAPSPLEPGALCSYQWEVAREVWQQVDQGDVQAGDLGQRADYPSMTGIALRRPLLQVEAMSDRLLYARSETRLLACRAKYKRGGLQLKQVFSESLLEPAIGLCPNPFDEGQIATVHETGLRIWSASGSAVDHWTLSHPRLAELPGPLSSEFHEVLQRPVHAATWWRHPRQLLVAGASIRLLDLRDHSQCVLGAAFQAACPLYEAACTVDRHPWEEHQFVAIAIEPVQLLLYDVRKDSGPLCRWPLPERYRKDYRAQHQPGHVVWGRTPGTDKTVLATPCRSSSDIALYAWSSHPETDGPDDAAGPNLACRLFPRSLARSDSLRGCLRGTCLLQSDDCLALICLRENGDLTCQWVQEHEAEAHQACLPAGSPGDGQEEGLRPANCKTFVWKRSRTASAESAQKRVSLGSEWLTSGSLRVALVLEKLGLVAAPGVQPEPLVFPDMIENFRRLKEQALAAERPPAAAGAAATGAPAAVEAPALATPLPVDDGGEESEEVAESEPDPSRMQIVEALPAEATVMDVDAEEANLEDQVAHAVCTGDCSALEPVPLRRRFRAVLDYFQVRLPRGWQPIEPAVPPEGDLWAERVRLSELCDVAFHVDMGTRATQTNHNLAQWSAAEQTLTSREANAAGVAALARALASVGVVRRLVDPGQRKTTGPLAEIYELYYVNMVTPPDTTAKEIARLPPTRDITRSDLMDLAAEHAVEVASEMDLDDVLVEPVGTAEREEAAAQDAAAIGAEPILPVSLRPGGRKQ